MKEKPKWINYGKIIGAFFASYSTIEAGRELIVAGPLNLAFLYYFSTLLVGVVLYVLMVIVEKLWERPPKLTSF